MHFRWLVTKASMWFPRPTKESALIPKGSLGAVDCGVNYVLERKGVKEQDGLTDLMKFRVW